MAIITNQNDLNQGTEITIDASAKTTALTVAGNLSNDCLLYTSDAADE